MIEKYLLIQDAQERLGAITSRGKKWPGPAAEERVPENRVQGCVSPVWLVPRLEDGKCRFPLAAESPVVQGLAALLCELYDGETPAEVAAVEPEIMEELGIARQLSPTRLQGLTQVRRAIREFALARG